jgi:hypothetical protein
MRIPKGWVPPLSREIVEALTRKKFVELKTSKEELTEAVSELILDEFMVEDRLNKEVREILKRYDMEIEKGRLDYRKLFDLTKQKIVRERNIIL